MFVADASKGFIYCFLLNLLFGFMWVVTALVVFLLRFILSIWLNVPLWTMWIGFALLGIWIVISLIVAILVTVGANRPSKPRSKLDENRVASMKEQVSSKRFGPVTTAFLKQQIEADAAHTV